MRSPETLADPLPLHRLCVPEPERVPFAIGTFDSIGPLSRADYPHRHTFYEIAMVTSGTGRHIIDFTGHRLRPPHLSFITPGQVHHWQDVTELRGHVLLFTEAFLSAHPRDRHTWHLLSRRPWRRLNNAEAVEFAGLIAQMMAEDARREPGFLTILQAYLHVFLLRAARMTADETPSGDADRTTDLAQTFTRLLTSSPQREYSVREYATRLGVSVGHLTEVVKAVTGRTPGQLIRQVRTLEARRLLGGTDMPVGRISRQLGFGDPAYFCRFFRREAGMTPGEFRRRHGLSGSGE